MFEHRRRVVPQASLLGAIFAVALGVLTSQRWLLRVFAPGTMTRGAFSTPVGAIRNFVSRLGGRQQLVAVRPWPRASFDHRDPRLHRLFVISYAPRGDARPDARRGLFVTAVRDGFHGRRRVLEATTQPYD